MAPADTTYQMALTLVAGEVLGLSRLTTQNTLGSVGAKTVVSFTVALFWKSFAITALEIAAGPAGERATIRIRMTIMATTTPKIVKRVRLERFFGGTIPGWG